MPLKFHKMHGAGNDFVVADLRHQDFPIDEAVARSLAHRNTGIGCDQLLVLENSTRSAHVVRFEVWNADGSRAEQCGNGVRCIGLYLSMIGDAPAGPFTIQGPVADIGIEILGDQRVRVDMGIPDFRAASIPVTAPPMPSGYQLDLQQESVTVGAVSMGNPHAVMVVPDTEGAGIEAMGMQISRHQGFPQGCNAGFAQIIDRGHIKLRVFERGAGETLACGSGACAAAAVLMESGDVDRQVLIHQKGGEIMVDWPQKSVPLLMTGPATHVYEGLLL